MVTLNVWETILSGAAIIGAIVAIVGYFTKVVHWVDKQEAQDKDIKAIKEEQTVLTYGMLACLKGLKEQGCNGPVTDAINKVEKHLNQKAHE